MFSVRFGKTVPLFELLFLKVVLLNYYCGVKLQLKGKMVGFFYMSVRRLFQLELAFTIYDEFHVISMLLDISTICVKMKLQYYMAYWNT